MRPATFAKLVDAMEKIINLESDYREEYVYDELCEEMAKAARLVYVACIDGQRFAKDQ